jgi:hypothetical protein
MRRAHRAHIARHADELGQRRIKPIGIAGQPIAEEGQQLAQLDRIASIEAQKRTDPRLHHESRAYPRPFPNPASTFTRANLPAEPGATPSRLGSSGGRNT